MQERELNDRRNQHKKPQTLNPEALRRHPETAEIRFEFHRDEVASSIERRYNWRLLLAHVVCPYNFYLPK